MRGHKSPVAKEASVPFGLVGCDFRVASSRWRSAVVLGREERARLSEKLRQSRVVESVVFLDTCNRNEWIYAAADPCWAGEILKTQMVKRWQQMGAPVPRPYVLVADVAVRHVLRVAAGLESFVVGERQITTQFNRAVERARREGVSSAVLNSLGSVAARVARDVHETASPGCGLHGVHDVAARYLGRVLKAPATIAVVGCGEIGRRVSEALQQIPGFKVLMINRTARKGAHPLSDLPGIKAEAVVACTAASSPIVTPANLPGGPLILVDLGIPSQIERGCAARPGTQRVDLDDLLRSEELDLVAPEKLRAASDLVESGVRDFVHICLRRRFVSILDRTRQNHEDFVAKVLPRFIDEFACRSDAAARGQMEYRLRGIFRQYTNSLFRSINDSIGQED
ncbi:MAG: hypothetical protein HYX75_20290 [Acidobacteria bacterium]|nr:hypothetical protein [Acidobacteriota bacterium]